MDFYCYIIPLNLTILAIRNMGQFLSSNGNLPPLSRRKKRELYNMIRFLGVGLIELIDRCFRSW